MLGAALPASTSPRSHASTVRHSSQVGRSHTPATSPAALAESTRTSLRPRRPQGHAYLLALLRRGPRVFPEASLRQTTSPASASAHSGGRGFVGCEIVCEDYCADGGWTSSSSATQRERESGASAATTCRASSPSRDIASCTFPRRSHSDTFSESGTLTRVSGSGGQCTQWSMPQVFSTGSFTCRSRLIWAHRASCASPAGCSGDRLAHSSSDGWAMVGVPMSCSSTSHCSSLPSAAGSNPSWCTGRPTPTRRDDRSLSGPSGDCCIRWTAWFARPTVSCGGSTGYPRRCRSRPSFLRTALSGVASPSHHRLGVLVRPPSTSELSTLVLTGISSRPLPRVPPACRSG